MLAKVTVTTISLTPGIPLDYSAILILSVFTNNKSSSKW